MKKFLVVYMNEEKTETFIKFFTSYVSANTFRQDLECGLGMYSELYERVESESGHEYKLMLI